MIIREDIVQMKTEIKEFAIERASSEKLRLIKINKKYDIVMSTLINYVIQVIIQHCDVRTVVHQAFKMSRLAILALAIVLLTVVSSKEIRRDPEYSIDRSGVLNLKCFN